MIPVHIVGYDPYIALTSCSPAEAQVVLVINGEVDAIQKAAALGKPTLLYFTTTKASNYHMLRKNIIEVIHANPDGKPPKNLSEIITVAALANTEFQTADLASVKSTIRKSRIKAIVIASSTGGPATLEAIFSAIQMPFPVPIIVVQHLPPSFAESLANSLNDSCSLTVEVAQRGIIPQPGHIYIASSEGHLILKADGAIDYVDGPRECGVKPCANYLFKSAAHIYGQNLLGIVLTGMGKDGLEGSKVVKDQGGTVLAQDMMSSTIYGMPKEIVLNGLADAVVELKDIPQTMVDLVNL